MDGQLQQMRAYTYNADGATADNADIQNITLLLRII